VAGTKSGTYNLGVIETGALMPDQTGTSRDPNRLLCEAKTQWSEALSPMELLTEVDTPWWTEPSFARSLPLAPRAQEGGQLRGGNR